MKTYYQILKEKGFEREQLEDKSSFDVTGHHPYLMEKIVAKGLKWSFSSDDNHGRIRLIRFDKKGNVLVRMVFDFDKAIRVC